MSRPGKGRRIRVRKGQGPFILVIAGPNGAGKSTFHDLFLRGLGLPFVNADRIAREIDRLDPARVGYVAAAAADRVRLALVERGEAFCTETVLSDPAGDKLAFLGDAQARGYAVLLVFIGLESPDIAIGRVAQRVADGGHDVPPDKVAARFSRSLHNLGKALAFADRALLFDNSSTDAPYRFVADFAHGARSGRLGYRARWARGLLGGAPGAPRRGKPAVRHRV